MKKKPLIILAVAVALAACSFSYARHRHRARNSVTLTNPFDLKEKVTLTSPVPSQNLFGNWMKEERTFAIIIPLLLLAGGAYAAFHK